MVDVARAEISVEDGRSVVRPVDDELAARARSAGGPAERSDEGINLGPALAHVDQVIVAIARIEAGVEMREGNDAAVRRESSLASRRRRFAEQPRQALEHVGLPQCGFAPEI